MGHYKHLGLRSAPSRGAGTDVEGCGAKGSGEWLHGANVLRSSRSASSRGMAAEVDGAVAEGSGEWLPGAEFYIQSLQQAHQSSQCFLARAKGGGGEWGEGIGWVFGVASPVTTCSALCSCHVLLHCRMGGSGALFSPMRGGLPSLQAGEGLDLVSQVLLGRQLEQGEQDRVRRGDCM